METSEAHRIKKILAQNLLIYISRYCVSRSSWSATTLANLIYVARSRLTNLFRDVLTIYFTFFRVFYGLFEQDINLRGQLKLEFDGNLLEGEGLGLTFLSHRWPSKPVPLHWQSIYREDWYLEYKWHFLSYFYIACIQSTKLYISSTVKAHPCLYKLFYLSDLTKPFMVIYFYWSNL